MGYYVPMEVQQWSKKNAGSSQSRYWSSRTKRSYRSSERTRSVASQELPDITAARLQRNLLKLTPEQKGRLRVELDAWKAQEDAYAAKSTEALLDEFFVWLEHNTNARTYRVLDDREALLAEIVSRLLTGRVVP